MIVIFWILLALLYFKFNYKLLPGAKIAIGIILSAIALFSLWYAIGFLGIFITIILLGGCAYAFYVMEDKKQDEEIANWRNQRFQHFDSYTFYNIIEHNCNSNFVKYKGGDIPYNRMLYFSSGSKENNDSDRVFPIYYHAFGAKNNLNFEEHGFLVTTAEIIIKKYKSANKQDESDTLELFIPFNNIYKVTQDSKKNITVFYADKTTININVLTDEESDLIYQIINIAINSGWSTYVRSYISDSSQYEDNKQEEIIERTVEFVKNQLDVEEKNRLFSESMSAATILKEGIPGISINQINDRFGGGQGHGHVGEQAGHVLDKFKFKNAIQLGASHKPYGADRIVNGKLIQTKYCSTAGESIGSCFKNGEAVYLNPDKSMMQIEVPRDQYAKAVDIMRKRIQRGEVPFEDKTNGHNAYKYIKKGALTYEQSQIATKSIFDRNSTIQVRDSNGKLVKDTNGNIITRTVSFREKLFISAGLDFTTGMAMATPTAAVAAVWIYCNNRWRGINNSDALKNSLKTLVKPILFSGFTYMLSAQFGASKLGQSIATSMYKATGKTVPEQIAKSTITKGTMITITAAVTVGPDLVRALRGRISWGQLVKNTSVTGAGMAAGMALGSFIPVVGTVLGGIGGAYVAKKVVDSIREDDAVQMIQIAKEEFIDTVMMAGFTTEEFNDVLQKTFLHKDFNIFLQKMYSTGDDARRFVRETYENLINEYYDKRELPAPDEIIDVIATEAILSQ